MDDSMLRALNFSLCFQDVPDHILLKCDPSPEWVEVAQGETIIEQGEVGKALFFIVYGRCVALKKDKYGHTKRLGELYPGQIIGEISLITDQPATATVRAMHHSRLVRFSREAFLHMVAEVPQITFQAARIIANRLQGKEAYENQQRRTVSLALLPLHDDIDCDTFADQLQNALNNITKSIIVDSTMIQDYATCPSHTEINDAQYAVIHQQFIRLAEMHNLLILKASHQVTSWTSLCVCRSDRILLVASAKHHQHALTQLEKQLFSHMDAEITPHIDLVLIHAQDQWSITHAEAWRAKRYFQTVYHVRQNQPQDYQRLARRLMGSASGLVVGGGGARSLAHLGVIKALREADIPIDMVAGTSMGAFIAALYAMDLDMETMIGATRRVWVDWRPLSDYDYPAIAMIKGKRLERACQELWSGWSFDDLPLSCFCMVADITNCRAEAVDRGPVWRGVRSSCSLPGIGPPFLEKDRLWVDGGVIDNLPVEVMQKKYGHEINQLIVTDIFKENIFKAPEKIPTGWPLFWQRFNPWSKSVEIPRMFDILYRSATLASEQGATQGIEKADLVFRPSVDQYGLLEFKALSQCVEIGYQEAIKVLNR
ncbi:cyclic nucleotide-binding and patatin-like phospholipase domain-containing protein [Magnetococcales bacterium HHB-1]